MARRGKKKSKQARLEGTNDKSNKERQPKIVEDIADSDDEEIDEDEAFNSEDERLYGHFFNKKSSKDSGGGDSDGEDAEEVTSEEEGDDDASNDEDDDKDDGGDYMLSLLDKLDTSKKRKGNESAVSRMANIPESDYSSSISQKGLTLDSLMEGLEDTQGFKNLQKTFRQQQATTPAPLEKVVANRTQRKIAYQDQNKNMAGWTNAIQENRKAETLDFKPKERVNVTRDTLVDKFEATTDFEKELETALEEAGQQDEEAVLKAEEQALQDDLGANRLTMEEYKKRRGQLAQVRALMFYHEQKMHHIKKIKSKKYRRIRKKQRERQKESAVEAAMQEDEDLAKELKEKEEVSRIQERMTLAHKNTSKWAKRILKRGKNVDLETRKALSAQLKRGDDLRRKMLGDDDQDSGNDSDEDLVESARKVLADTEETADPTQGKTGLFKLSFMQKGIQKQREQAKEEARKLLQELQSNEQDDFDKAIEGDDIDEIAPPKKEKMASEKEMKQVLGKGELVATSLGFGNSNTISTSGGIDIDISTDDNKDESDEQEAAVSDAKASSGLVEHVSTLEVAGAKRSGKAPSTQDGSPSKRSKKATQASTKSKAEDDEANPWMKSNETSQNGVSAPAKAKRSKKGVVDVEGAVDILDAGMVKGNDVRATAVVDNNNNDENNDTGDKKITTLTQEELVKRAFAATSENEVEEEFRKEKEDMAAEDDPTRKVEDKNASQEVAGWGSWAGAGAPPPRRQKLPKKLQAPKKAEPSRKRKDDYKPDVIINQKRIKKMANTFMLGDVPHPYSSRAEYEQAMLGGVGKEWNVTNSFKNMTRPEILTRSGKIIQPISKKAKVARAPAKF